ncbi:putative fructose-bisphosphate aldolase [Colletotrichum shisoi]|uniref:Fructose-bisphosphate aldolase n=1 Tax=Colletotrichum shisoi TaxID=2078593 RepID=A0A5Q4BSN6_9PEZI|nr:putative fructose-bisphosphate aldolase [Colletotrichum shisoi]
MTVPATWRDSNRTIQILAKAEAGRYGVIAATAYNLEQIHGLAVTFADGLLVRAAKDAVSRAAVPVSIHLDHAQDEAIIQHAADRPPALRQHHGGHVPSRRGGDPLLDGEASKTTPEEVDEFIATGVDSLAPAFGNVHGECGKQGPQLDFERCQPAVTKDADEPPGSGGYAPRSPVGRGWLCMGTNGFSPELMGQCVAAGATKINVNKLVLDDYYAHIKSQAAQLSHTTLIEEGTSKVTRQTKEWMEICGSAGQA